MSYDDLPTLIEYARGNDGELPEILEFASENRVLGSYLNLGNEFRLVFLAIEAIRIVGWMIIALVLYIAVFGVCFGSIFLI